MLNCSWLSILFIEFTFTKTKWKTNKKTNRKKKYVAVKRGNGIIEEMGKIRSKKNERSERKKQIWKIKDKKRTENCLNIKLKYIYSYRIKFIVFSSFHFAFCSPCVRALGMLTTKAHCFLAFSEVENSFFGEERRKSVFNFFHMWLHPHTDFLFISFLCTGRVNQLFATNLNTKRQNQTKTWSTFKEKFTFG